jgi:hypothetical protein
MNAMDRIGIEAAVCTAPTSQQAARKGFPKHMPAEASPRVDVAKPEFGASTAAAFKPPGTSTPKIVFDADTVTTTSRENHPDIAFETHKKACRTAIWDSRLKELAAYREIYGHCNVPRGFSENAILATWVNTQRTQYKLHLEGNRSSMTPSRIQELERLGFEWDSHHAVWEDRLNELADYRKIHGHCNVPANYSENSKLGCWVLKQRCQHRLHVKGKRSEITLPRIQELESLGFQWGSGNTSWEDRLSELADYRKLNGHCNVPQRYFSENSKLGKWVAKQRTQYKLHLKGKAQMSTFRIQELESLGLEWRQRITTTGKRKRD